MALPPDLLPGDVVAIPYRGVQHTGIVSHAAPGDVRIIHKSKSRGRVVEDTVAGFSGGAPVSRVGYPGKLPPEAVVERARARLGERWTHRRNCQHFVAGVHGAPFRSGDADRAALFLLFAFGAAAVASRRYRR